MYQHVAASARPGNGADGTTACGMVTLKTRRSVGWPLSSVARLRFAKVGAKGFSDEEITKLEADGPTAEMIQWKVAAAASGVAGS